MLEHGSTTIFHLLILGIQIVCLVSLWNDHFLVKSRGAGLHFGYWGAITLFWVHLLIWAQETNAPANLGRPIITLFGGWTVMLAIFANQRHKKVKAITQQTEVKS